MRATEKKKKKRKKTRSISRSAIKGGAKKKEKKIGVLRIQEKTAEVCFSKNVTVCVITGDVSDPREKVVNTERESDNS